MNTLNQNTLFVTSHVVIFFKAKHVYKQDTNSGALAGGIVSLAIVLLAVAIIIFIYRR